MADEEQVKLLKSGVEAWNKWREENPDSRIGLSWADLSGADLTGGVGTYRGDLSEPKLSGPILSGANLRWTVLTGASFHGAHLRGADLHGADLRQANLSLADLSGANLSEADVTQATFGYTALGRISLGAVRGLERTRHEGPSSVGTDTLKKSAGKIPESFLRGCGLEDWEIEAAQLYDPSLGPEQITTLLYRIDSLRGENPIQINPLFISYSHGDTAFVEALEKQLDKARIRYWRDVHHLEAGRVEKQIEQAIALNPCVLLVLSRNSVESDWVEWEVSQAREFEKKIKRDVLCPVTLDDAWKTCDWPGPLRRQIEDYYIVDFSEWKTEEKLQGQFRKLRKGLQINYSAEKASRG